MSSRLHLLLIVGAALLVLPVGPVAGQSPCADLLVCHKVTVAASGTPTEASGVGTFTLTRELVVGSLTVTFQLSGTATNGTDYVAAPAVTGSPPNGPRGTVTF